MTPNKYESENRDHMAQDVSEIKDDVRTIMNILNGKDGQTGLIARVDNHEKFINTSNKFKTDFWTTFFRTLITIVLGYIAWKVGLTPPG